MCRKKICSPVRRYRFHFSLNMSYAQYLENILPLHFSSESVSHPLALFQSCFSLSSAISPFSSVLSYMVHNPIQTLLIDSDTPGAPALASRKRKRVERRCTRLQHACPRRPASTPVHMTSVPDRYCSPLHVASRTVTCLPMVPQMSAAPHKLAPVGSRRSWRSIQAGKQSHLAGSPTVLPYIKPCEMVRCG